MPVEPRFTYSIHAPDALDCDCWADDSQPLGSQYYSLRGPCILPARAIRLWRCKMQNPYELERLVWNTEDGDYQFVSTPRPLGIDPASITIDGQPVTAEHGEWLIDSILRVQELAHV